MYNGDNETDLPRIKIENIMLLERNKNNYGGDLLLVGVPATGRGTSNYWDSKLAFRFES